MKPVGDLERAIDSFRLKTTDSLDQRITASILGQSADRAPRRSFLLAAGAAMTYRRWPRYATAAAIALGAILVLLVVNKTASLTLADVKAAVQQNVHSVRYRHTSTFSGSPGHQPFSLVTEVLIEAPSRMRQSNPQGIVVISDDQLRKTLLLNTPQKEALILEYGATPDLRGIHVPRQEHNLLDELRTMDETSAQPLGQKTVAGRTAVGFEIAGGKETILVDPQTRLPLEIRRIAQVAGDPPMTETVTMSDFEWNTPVDESLLSLTPPAGYTVHTGSDVGALDASEQQLLQALRTFAKFNDGRFPEELNQASFEEAMRRMFEQKDGQQPDIAAMQKELFGAIGGMAFLQSRGATDWHYAGAGVPLDQPNTPILWYRPKGSATFRVIYADLSVRDVAADALPAIASQPLQTTRPASPVDYDPTATPTEDDLLTSLRMFAELNDNHLPDNIGYQEIRAALEQIQKRQGHMTLSEKGTFMLKEGRITHGISFITMGGGSDWHYAGASVSLGTAGHPMLWYRPRGSTGYRLIDADLSAREVRAEDLPKVPSTLVWEGGVDALAPGGPVETVPIEHDVVEALRYLAELSGGKFPDHLSMTTYNDLQGQADDAAEQEQDQHQMKMGVIFRGLRFITDGDHGDDWHYAGKDAALGQPGRPVLWYRPKDSAVYRVIDADLTVQPVAKEALPAIPSVTLTQNSIFGSETERDLLYTLRMWAELNGGKFPADLSRKAAQKMAFAGAGKDFGSMSPDEMRLEMVRQQKASRMSRGIIFLALVGKHQYAGVEVPMGQAGTPILWYKPRKSATWRVIYADLSVHDVAKENLPVSQSQLSGE